MKHHADDLFQHAARSGADRLRERRRGDVYLRESAVSRQHVADRRTERQICKRSSRDGQRAGRSLDYVAGWFMKAADYGTAYQCRCCLCVHKLDLPGPAGSDPVAADLSRRASRLRSRIQSFKWANLASQQRRCHRASSLELSNQSQNATTILDADDGASSSEKSTTSTPIWCRSRTVIVQAAIEPSC